MTRKCVGHMPGIYISVFIVWKCVGYHSEADAPRRRLAKPLIFCRTESDCPLENGYARPVEGIHVLVDMQNMTVIEFEDRKLVPLPPADPLRNYTSGETRGGVDRGDVKSLQIVQPEGPSFRIHGNFVEWQKWNFRIGFTPREGLIIHSVAYIDGSRGRRPIAHRLSFVEMVVPYGDPNDPHYRKNAFDAGEDGLGKNAHSLKKRQGKALPEASLPFHRATLSITHMALVELEKAGILKFLISQNVDGLHLRSGISREIFAELHGNSFMEQCPSCGAEYMRDFEIETIGLKETTRRCSKTGCGGKLRDTVLDWEDALPPKEMNPAEKHCKMADLVLCLGTSLQITPACNLPLRCLKGGGEIVIVNLQKTPKDKKADLVIHGRADKVIAGVMKTLNMCIPPFVRIDFFQVLLSQALSLDKKYVNWTLKIASVHGKQAPLPFVKSVEIAFPDSLNMKETILTKHPLYLKRRTVRTTEPFEISLKLNFSAGCKCSFTQIKIPVNFEISTDCLKEDKDSIIQKLKDRAIEEPCCGQTALIERKTVLVPKSDIFVHAVVTNIIEYETSQGVTLDISSHNNGTFKRRNGFDCGISWKQTKARNHKSRQRR